MNTKFPLLFFCLFYSFLIQGQVIWTDPVFPQQTDEVTIYFDASKGNAALASYTGTVYAHTGVITNNSTSGTDWQHVQGNWGTVDPPQAMTALGNSLYSKTFNISTYYGISAGEIVEQMAFVFRNTDGSLVARAADGSDIFTPVYSNNSALLTTFVRPSNTSFIVEANDTIDVLAASSRVAQLSLYDNGMLLTQTTANELSYELIPTTIGNHDIELVAEDGGETTSSNFSFIVSSPTTIENPPMGTELGITYLSDTDVRLALYAPDKEQVFVKGDFNSWQLDPAYQMKRSADGTVFWLDINGLTAGQEYAFQYLVDGSITISDPYSTVLLDAWNDPFIPNVTYPNLKPFPSGATTGYATLLQPGKPAYDWQVDNFEKPDQSSLVVYELLMRDFLARHDYQTLIDTLDYLDRLGVTAIELMPPNEFEGNDSWGYNPSFHGAVDKYYGSVEDLKAFIDECHSRGIAVIFDVVFNHAFSLNPLCQLYWDAGNFRPSPDNPWLNVEATHAFNVGYDFNHESDATRVYVKKILSRWIEEFRVDGFRFDLSKGLTQNVGGDFGAFDWDPTRVAILLDYANHIWSLDEDNYVILEHFAANSEEKFLSDRGLMLWGGFNIHDEYLEAAMGYDNNLIGVDYQLKGWSNPNLLAYMESHDEERMLYKCRNFGNASQDGSYNIRNPRIALERAELASAFFFPIPGPKMIWQFGELGYDFSINYCRGGGVDPNCRLDPKPIRWDYGLDANRLKLYNVMSGLLHLKQNYKVFKTTDYDLNVIDAYKKSIHLNDDEMDVTIVGNFDVVPQSVNPNFQQSGIWYDYFSGDSITVSDPQALLDYEPGEYHLYTSVRLPEPPGGYTTGTVAIKNLLPTDFKLNMIPNPTSETTSIQFELESSSFVNLSVYNTLGQEVINLINAKQDQGRHNVTWDAKNKGLYFVRIEVDGKTKTEKLLVH